MLQKKSDNDDEDDYILIGNTKIIVGRNGDGGGFVKDARHLSSSSDPTTSERSASQSEASVSEADLDDYIDVLNEFKEGITDEDESVDEDEFITVNRQGCFNEYFAELDLGNQGYVEDIIETSERSDEEGCDELIVLDSSGNVHTGSFGEKGKYRRRKREKKKSVAKRRLQKANERGVSITKANAKIKEFIETGLDMIAFAPMSKFGCKQVKKLAGLYQCNATFQGSGAKKMCVLKATRHTRLPTGKDKEEVDRMLKLEADALQIQSPEPANKTKSRGGKKKNQIHSGQKAESVPINFVSSGFIDPAVDVGSLSKEHGSDNKGTSQRETSCTETFKASVSDSVALSTLKSAKAKEKKRKKDERRKAREQAHKCSQFSEQIEITGNKPIQLASFERHTLGIGSKLLTKWGFKGSGLGKHGQGISEPLKVETRPEKLGLGA